MASDAKTSRDSVWSFIRQQSSISIDKLYGKSISYTTSDDQQEDSRVTSSWACKAVFQSLSQLGKSYVLRLLFVATPLDVSTIEEWVYEDKRSLHNEVIDELTGYRILLEVYDDFGGDNASKKVILNKHFQASLLYALTKPAHPWEDTTAGRALKPDKSPPSPAFLQEFSRSRWNAVLCTLLNMPLPAAAAGASDLEEKLRLGTIGNYLRAAGFLVSTARNKDSYQISSEGYEYMLRDNQAQVWAYVHASLARMATFDEALSLLFMLSYCQAGRSYALDALTKTQRQWVFEFSHFGLVYIPNLKSSRFYPTEVAVNLIFDKESVGAAHLKGLAATNGGSSLRSTEREEGAAPPLLIIVQTNCTVTAYVTSELHIAMLAVFVDINLKMPNMVMGRLTRDKIKDAYTRGIRSSQIVDFLSAYAHPLVAARESVVPSNIKDQLLLWEAEQHRMRARDAHLVAFGDLPGMTDATFRALLDYSTRHLSAGVLFVNEAEMVVAYSPQAFEQICSYYADTYC